MKISPDIISVLNSKDIFNNSHDAFIISDSERIMRFVNRSALKMFGYSEEELIGKSILSLMPEDRTANYSSQMNDVLSGKIVSNIGSGEDLRGKKKNGEDFSIELTYVCSKSGTENYFISQIRDISERKSREKELKMISNTLKVITESNRLLIRSEDERSYLQGICDIITASGGYSKSLILLVEKKDDDIILIPAAFSGYEPDSDIKTPFLFSVLKGSGSPTRLAIEEQRTYTCRNIKARGLWKYWKDDPDEMEFDSTVSVPMMVKDQVIGLLRVYSYDPFAFDDQEVRLFEELAEDISHGITVLRERKELKTTTVALNVLTEANRILTGAQNEHHYLNDICKIITETGKFVRAVIHTVENIENDDKLIRVGGSIGFDDDSGFKLETHKLSMIKNWKSPTVLALREKKVNICENISARGLWKYWVDKPEKMEFESTVAVPVVYNDDVIALIRIYSEDPFYFKEQKLKLLDELSKDIAHGLNYLRTKAQNADSENKYRTLFENSSDGVYLADAETGKIFDVNNKATDIIGLPAERIIGLKYSEIHPPGAGNACENVIENLLSDKCNSSCEAFIRSLSASGKAVPVQISANFFYLNGRKVIQSIFRDITQIKAQEDKIRNIQKMEALGTLSGGIAHDINNILSPIIGFTQIALIESDNKEKQINCLNEVLTAAGRAKELISQILTFCRKSETDKKPVRIHSIIKEVLKLISSSAPDNVTLEAVIDDNCGHIMCDPIQIYQVLINLCTNAFYAMKETGGVLKVCLVRKGSPEIKIEKNEFVPFDDYICLIVSDTGLGMTKTILNRIFEPYFTTKPKGEGTGLGLSVVSGIVREHGGEIYTRTYPNEGTYFKISFPLAVIEPDKKPDRLKKDGISKRLRILVVDDEPQITFMLKYMLEELGYIAIDFNDPKKAFEAFISEPYRFDMLITDQAMPGIEGTELSERFLAVRPDFPIILNTGYSPVISKKEALKLGIREFMMKPITISDLSIMMERAMKNKE
ncbi:MAG: PAS domain S-box protein [Candidatus Delongbacteria bacterium]|nr:PAS domain S-box protein [Candidatus Delongbacteria bacterium]